MEFIADSCLTTGVCCATINMVLLPLPDESAASFALRLARNFQLSLQDFCQGYLGLTAAQARSDLDQILPKICSATLAALAGISESEVRGMAIPSGWVQSTRDQKRRCHVGLVHVCPDCLAENQYGRRFWRTHFGFVCPIHGVEMIGLCPHCRCALTYFNSADSPLDAHWLENWPNCPHCFGHFLRGKLAHPLVFEVTQQCARAFDGQSVRGLTVSVRPGALVDGLPRTK